MMCFTEDCIFRFWGKRKGMV